MGAIRRQINYAMDNGLSDVLAFEAEQQRTCGRTQDFAAARAAFGSRKRIPFMGQ